MSGNGGEPRSGLARKSRRNDVAEKLTVEMIRAAVKHLKKHAIKGDYIARIPESRTQEAFDLGLEPFCPLTDDDWIECALPEE